MAELISNLTIVIPTYNRHYYLLRNIHYLSKKQIKVIVLDGSSVAIDQDLISQYKNVSYFHLPISFPERIAFSGNLITTKYAALLGDDDFFLESGLSAIIKELEENSDLISCMGACLNFNINGKDIIYRPYYNEMNGYHVSNNDPVERMHFHMSNYTCSSIYSVIRSEFWIKAVGILGEKTFADPAIPELEFELAISYFGKSKVIPVISWLRSNENPSLANKLEHDFHDIWNESIFYNEKRELIKILSNNLNNSDIDQIEINIEKSYDLYCNWRKNKNTKIKKSNFSYKSIVNTILPSIIIKKLKFTLNKFIIHFMYNNEFHDQDLMSTLKIMNKKNILFNQTELIELENFLHNFNQNSI